MDTMRHHRAEDFQFLKLELVPKIMREVLSLGQQWGAREAGTDYW